MKFKLALIGMFFALSSNAQLMRGNVERQPSTHLNYLVPYSVSGNIMFELAINNRGEVTSVKVLRSESSINSVMIENEYIVKFKQQLKFNADNGAPAFEKVKFNVKTYISNNIPDTSVYPVGYDDVFDNSPWEGIRED